MRIFGSTAIYEHIVPKADFEIVVVSNATEGIIFVDGSRGRRSKTNVSNFSRFLLVRSLLILQIKNECTKSLMKVTSKKRSGTDAIRTQIQSSKQNGKKLKLQIVRIQNEQVVNRVTAFSQNVATQQAKPN